jgi:Ca-activated chloride channel family protein
MIPSQIRLLRFVFVAFLCAAIASAQDSPYTLRVDVAMVSLDVAVFNASGTPVTNLNREDFQIYEDGKPQQIQSFAASSTPYNVLLVIDKSGSMYSQVRFVSEAINRFFSNLRTQDRVALASFDSSVHMLVDWRGVRTGPSKRIDLGAGGNTDFYSALDWAARQLGKIKGRKAVLIFTDGEDYRIFDPRVDAVAFRKALEKVRRTRTPFHFVGLGADPDRGGAHLKEIAEQTGGQAYFPATIEEVVPLYDQISRELGISYTLGYVSDKPARDGSYRKIQVAVAGKDYRVSQSRPGYVAN